MLERNVPFMFNPRDAAKILSISRSQIYVLLKSGELESVQIGRSRRISQDQMIRFINNLDG
jgi:excisionase family DNA binding protein